MGKRTLLVGYDLGDQFTQIGVYHPVTFQPVLIGGEDDRLPTEISLEGQGEMVTDFMSRIRNKEDVMVGGKVADPVNLLSYYFRKTLTLVKGEYPADSILQLVISLNEYTKDVASVLYLALEKLGIGRDRAMVIGNKQSYLYYALCQKKELWLNDVGLFDYNGQELVYYQMSIDRRRTPILVGITKRDYSEMMLSMESVEDRGKMFESIALGAMHRQIISTLYLMGDGFDGGWADEIFQKLCVGRRVFKGKNLYVSGACYAARELSGEGKLEDFVFLDEDMIRAHISIKVYSDGKQRDLVLAKAGIPWYEEVKEIDLIPENEEELVISVTNIMRRETKEYYIPIEGIRGRENKMFRLGLRICFQDVSTCIVTLKDKGFGDFAPSSNRIWEEVINL